MNPHCNDAGRALIRAFEGLRLTAYKCPAGFWTVGYGHTLTARPGLRITETEADKFLTDDLARVENSVAALVRVPLTSNQFSALCCLAFNIGTGAFGGSSLRRLLNRGWYDQVPVQMKRWTKVNGQPLPGLERRRAAEAALWNTPDPLLLPPTQTTSTNKE